MRIRLTVWNKATNTNDFVVNLDIPPFKEAPEVVIWGDRVFAMPQPSDTHITYREVFAYTSPVEP